MNPNRDPQAETLSRFTPDTSLLNRDELMFAAGRASVRPGRFWHGLAGLLALSQVVTLVFLWPDRPAPAPTESRPVVVAPVEPVREELEPPNPSPPERNSLISQHRLLRDDLETGYRPIANASLMTDSKVIFTARTKLNWE